MFQNTCIYLDERVQVSGDATASPRKGHMLGTIRIGEYPGAQVLIVCHTKEEVEKLCAAVETMASEFYKRGPDADIEILDVASEGPSLE